MHFIYIKSEPILCPPMLRNQRPKALCWMRHVARKPSSSRLSSQSCAKAMVWTSPLKVARFVSPKISVRICMEDLQTLRWLWHIMDLWWFIWWYRCFRLSEWFRRVAKKKFKEISSHIGVCLKIGYPKKSAGWISHRNPHYIQTECLVYNLLHIIHIYIYVYMYIYRYIQYI